MKLTDKAEKEKVEKINQADSLIFQTEKQLKEYGDKIPADKKAPIEAALEKLKGRGFIVNFKI
jgi:molecular chaperone DnaK